MNTRKKVRSRSNNSMKSEANICDKINGSSLVSWRLPRHRHHSGLLPPSCTPRRPLTHACIITWGREKSAGSKLGGCFPGRGEVVTPQGSVPLEVVRAGDLVQVMREDGSLAFSPVLMFLHRDPRVSRSFLRLTTASGTTLTLTSSHLIFLLEGGLAPSATPTVEDALQHGGVVLAGRLESGDFLLVAGEGGVRLEKGTVVVDGVVASCYAVIDSQAIAHWAFLPVRLYINLREAMLTLLRSVGGLAPPAKAQAPVYGTTNTTADSVRWREGEVATNSLREGDAVHIHWYPRMLYTLASWLLPSHLVYS
ncbi:hypothetical protein O3P69_001957 [Scylla paramamosain]|uniref:Hint domain-containing protein n=1 Tax=Scylla paramamosain TaxID=85552 RepID=A0AAW0V1X6_SCYPA